MLPQHLGGRKARRKIKYTHTKPTCFSQKVVAVLYISHANQNLSSGSNTK